MRIEELNKLFESEEIKSILKYIAKRTFGHRKWL